MPSTRTPLSGQISMLDLDKSLTLSWSTPTAGINMHDIMANDFASSLPGFAYCYGPGVGANDLVHYYDMLGYVAYGVRATGVNNVGHIDVNFNPMNGSNGQTPGQINLDAGAGELPNGDKRVDGAHWATLQFVVQVTGMTGGSFDVYFDGTYIDTIFNDGMYVYDNGAVGYTNGYGPNVYVDFV